MTAHTPIVSDLYPEEIYQIKDRVLIVLTTSWESVSEEDKTLLAKILGAIRLSLDGVQIISQQKPDFQAIKMLSPKWVIRFSNDYPKDYYKAESIEGSIIVNSHLLSDLDDARKKSLWMALKGFLQP